MWINSCDCKNHPKKLCSRKREDFETQTYIFSYVYQLNFFQNTRFKSGLLFIQGLRSLTEKQTYFLNRSLNQVMNYKICASSNLKMFRWDGPERKSYQSSSYWLLFCNFPSKCKKKKVQLLYTCLKVLSYLYIITTLKHLADTYMHKIIPF